MKLNMILALTICLALFASCGTETRHYEKTEILLMEPGNHAIIANKVRAAHLICIDQEGCNGDNDTIMSTYYDGAGRLVKMRSYDSGTVEIIEYGDNSNWEVKRTYESENRVYNIGYVVDDATRILIKIVTSGTDTIAVVQYQFDEQGKVFQYGPDLSDAVHFITYNTDGLITKDILDYEKSEPGQIDRMEDMAYYSQGKLDSIVRNFYDLQGGQARPTLYIRCRKDGLMDRVNGAKEYMFHYEF